MQNMTSPLNTEVSKYNKTCKKKEFKGHRISSPDSFYEQSRNKQPYNFYKHQTSIVRNVLNKPFNLLSARKTIYDN